MTMRNCRYCTDLIVCTVHERKRQDTHKGTVSVIPFSDCRLALLKCSAGSDSSIEHIAVRRIISVQKPIVELSADVLRDYFATMSFKAIQCCVTVKSSAWRIK